MKLLVASQNRDKARELAHALQGLAVDVLTFDDVGKWPEVEEDGATLDENAEIKAAAGLARFGMATLADDTGLEVDALGGAPGVFSARYAGPGATYADNVQKLLRELTGVPTERRGARFACAVALVDPDGRRAIVRGEVLGRILEEPRGSGGFGYDPVFFVPEVGRTFAEMTLEEKRTVSHRGRAVQAARKVLAEWYGVE